MLKSCKYCNRIHDRKYDCGRKPKRRKQPTDAIAFRNTTAWQHKREDIRQRDKNLCQLCLRGYSGAVHKYNYDDLSVHHAVPIEVDYDKRLDDDNLITTCELHHEAMESGEIPLEEVLTIIKEQENARNG